MTKCWNWFTYTKRNSFLLKNSWTLIFFLQVKFCCQSMNQPDFLFCINPAGIFLLVFKHSNFFIELRLNKMSWLRVVSMQKLVFPSNSSICPFTDLHGGYLFEIPNYICKTNVAIIALLGTFSHSNGVCQIPNPLFIQTDKNQIKIWVNIFYFDNLMSTWCFFKCKKVEVEEWKIVCLTCINLTTQQLHGC